MPDQLSANSSFDTLPRRPGPGGDEPEFSLRGAPRDPLPFSDSEGEERIRVASSPDAVQSRDHRTAVALPVGSLLYLVLVGFVAVATIGVFFGAGFLLLAHPEMQTIADPGTRDRAPPPPYGDAPRANREAPPVSRELAAPGSPAVASLPASPLAPHAAVAEMPAPEQSTATQDTPPLPSSEQRTARTASEPETASSSAVPSSPSAPSVSPVVPSSAEDAALPGSAKRRPTHHGRSHYARSASRHLYPRSSSAPSLTPPQSPATRYLARARTGQTGSFDQLLGQLTGPAKPAAGSLTPPRGQ